MKKYFMIAAAAILAYNANAQKLEKPLIDKITGDTTLNTKIEVLSNPLALIQHALTVNTSKTKDYVLLCFHVKDAIKMYYSVDKGDKATIKFVDGKLLEINAAT